MDDNQSSASQDPNNLIFGMPYPKSGGGAAAISSPYLNFDPSLLSPGAQNEFIFPEGASRHGRGRFELAFSQIGGSVMSGAALGGVLGTYKGIRATNALSTPSAAVRRSQMLNYITKNGSSTANTFGVVALVYSAIGVGLSFVQDSNDDLNTIAAGTTTGFLYKLFSASKTPETSPGEELATTKRRLVPDPLQKLKLKPWQRAVRRSAFGALIGFCLSAAWVGISNKDKYFRNS